jgi:hypothetical protein
MLVDSSIAVTPSLLPLSLRVIPQSRANEDTLILSVPAEMIAAASFVPHVLPRR